MRARTVMAMAAALVVLAWRGPGAAQEEAKPEERVYDVSDLVLEEAPPSIAPRGELLLQEERAREARQTATQVSVPPAPAPGGSVGWLAEDVIRQIPGMNEGGEVEVLNDPPRLRVVAPAAVQERVAAVVAACLQRMDLGIRIECLIVPADAIAAAAPGWAADAPYLADDAFRKLAADPRSHLSVATARNGQRIELGRSLRRSFLSDYEVNQTGVMPVMNPVVEVVAGGERFEVVARLNPGGSAVSLECAAQVRALDANRTKFSPRFGELELPVIEEVTLWSNAVLPLGRTLVVGSFSNKQTGQVFVVRATPARAPAPDEPAPVTSVPLRVGDGEDGPSFAVIDLPPGLLPVREVAVLTESPWSGRSDADLAGFVEGLFSTCRRMFPDEDWDPVRLRLLPSGTALAGIAPARVEKFLEGFLRAKAGPPSVAVDVRLYSMPSVLYEAVRGRAANGEGDVLAPGWEAGIPPGSLRTRAVLTGAASRLLSARAARIETIVYDVEWVSGGTGFSIVQIPDPVTKEVASGLAVQARVRPGAEKGQLDLECAALAAETDTKNVREVTTPSYFTVIGGEEKGDAKGGANNQARADFVTMNLNLPSQEVYRFRARVKVPAGRDALLGASAGRDPKEMLVLVGAARIVEP